MCIRVLHRIARELLPLAMEGDDVLAVQSLMEGGLIEGALELHRDGEGADRAVVFRITALGLLHLRSFPQTFR